MSRPSACPDLRARLAMAAACALLLGGPVFAAAGASGALADLSLEELANITITSVSGRPERLSDAAASIYVITADDIRRSGATSLPEALRLAPNLQVARLDAGQYAISARGFNNAIGNKLLVLIDGRTIYAPFFSGVLWDAAGRAARGRRAHRGDQRPGRHAVGRQCRQRRHQRHHAPGGADAGRAGERERAATSEKDAAFRYGWTARRRAATCASSRSARCCENTTTTAASPQADGWNRSRGRLPRRLGATRSDAFTLQGERLARRSPTIAASSARSSSAPLEVSEFDVLGRSGRGDFADGSDLRLQAYYDHFSRDDALLYRPRENVVDLDFQQQPAVRRPSISSGAPATGAPATTCSPASSSASFRRSAR